jgi:Tfp pilus assembly protein PilV
MTITTLRDERGFTIAEILVALALLLAGLVGLSQAFASGYFQLASGGGQAQATALARQKLEELRNEAFTVGPVTGSDAPDAQTTRAWTIDLAAGSPAAPNRVAVITVTVTWRAGWSGMQRVRMETRRGEWG